MGIKSRTKKEGKENNRHQVFIALRARDQTKEEIYPSSKRNKIYPDKHPDDMTSEEWIVFKDSKKFPKKVGDGPRIYDNVVRVPVDQYTEYQNNNGTITLLNINKRVMLQKPYVMDAYKKEIVKSIKRAMQEREAAEQFKKGVENGTNAQ